jgi:hypothetical protein
VTDIPPGNAWSGRSAGWLPACTPRAQPGCGSRNSANPATVYTRPTDELVAACPASLGNAAAQIPARSGMPPDLDRLLARWTKRVGVAEAQVGVVDEGERARRRWETTASEHVPHSMHTGSRGSRVPLIGGAGRRAPAATGVPHQ